MNPVMDNKKEQSSRKKFVKSKIKPKKA